MSEESPQSSRKECEFEVQLGTRGKGSFVLTQQFILRPPGMRNYRVQIHPCSADGTFGKAVWENVINATSQTVLVNGDAGSATGRSCKQLQ